MRIEMADRALPRGGLAGAGSSVPVCVEQPVHFFGVRMPACDRAGLICVLFGVPREAGKPYLTVSGRAPGRQQPVSHARQSSF